jgi:blue copper oxidase
MKEKKRAVIAIIIIAVLNALPAAGETDRMSLPIPVLLESGNPELIIQEGELELPFGTSPTLGYNGSYLGPTIRIRNGDAINIKVTNTLKEPTTTHWHGLHVPAEFDGGPHQIIAAEGQWNPSFTIDQPAATLWYHPHLMGKTAEHVYRGLAGLFIIDDEYSDSLELPDEYGVNDIPLIIQDRRIDRSGSFTYQPSMPDLMHGYLGNILLVNGAFQPGLHVSGGTYRFRILNGSNSSIMALYFDDGRDFTVIASDGGFLPESVSTDELILAPGERFEILMDLSANEDLGLVTEVFGGGRFESLRITTGDAVDRYYIHPKSFSYTPVEIAPDTPKRSFFMETRGMRNFTINGQQMDMDTINFSLDRNTTELWTVENVRQGMMTLPHSFHVHDVQFSVLSVNGEPPHPLYAGPKDTVLLFPGDEIKIALRFEDYTGIYMYHCHFLEHEDAGMMGQFRVE